MTPAAVVLAASLTRFLDPYTQVVQTDDPAEGRRLSAERGYWAMPTGQVDPLAKKPVPRVLHTVFRVRDTPFAGYDPSAPSPLFKVNQVGYRPSAPKFAYMGAWLGPAQGAWKPRAAVTWELVDARTGAVVRRCADAGAPRVPDRVTQEGSLFTGEETREFDFSDVTAEGTYFVRVPGVGRSRTFRIAASAAEDAFRVHMGGLYQKRCGIAKEEPYTHWTAGACHTEVVRGTFASEEGTLEPQVRWFDIIRWNTDWKHGERVRLAGGWHDAADYDRRPSHLTVVNDLCAVYLMRPGNFRDGQLRLPEHANGIPDILDEAEWGLRHLLAGQQADGGVGTWVETVGHPGPGNVAADDPPGAYALARATRGSSLAYAAHAALLVRCWPAFRDKYLASAVRAFDFAVRTPPRTDIYEVKHRHHRFFTRSEAVYWTEDKGLPAAALVKAAVNLHALTGDERFLTPAVERLKEIRAEMGKRAWAWPSLQFSGEMAQGTPPALEDVFKEWRRRVLRAAGDVLRQIETAYAYRMPWWAPQKGPVHAMSWGTCHPLRRAQALVAAHGLTGEAKWLDAASLANDFHNGCNPQGTTLTSGLGEVYPVAFLDLPSYVDGRAEYVPGITPYRWTYGLNWRAVNAVWGGDRARAAKWPILRRWCNMENQSVAASEYTVNETMSPAASVTGYLITPPPPDAPPPSLPPQPAPAARLRDLPGYWLLP